MAKVQFGAGIDAITGSIGGWTFHRNRSGNIVRARGAALRNSTTKQTQAHQTHIKFLQLWQALTSDSKNLWNVYADTWTKTDKFGAVKTLSGQNWFESINFNLELVGSAISNAPPVHTLPIAVQDYDFIIDSNEIDISFTPDFNPADNALVIFTTSFNTRVTTSQRQFQRLTKVIQSGPYNRVNITPDWVSTHGITWPPSALPVCGRIAVEVRTINKTSGIASTALSKTDAIT